MQSAPRRNRDRQLTDRSQLRGRLAYLFQSGEGTDVEFLVSDPAAGKLTKFSAHRCILLTCSAPMRLLLQQRPQSQAAACLVENCSPDAFGQLLRFLYTGCVAVSERNALDCFVVSDRFDVPQMRNQAELYLPRAMFVGRAAADLHAAASAQQLQLVAYISAYIARHFDSFLETAGFLALPQCVLVALLSSPNVAVENEQKILISLVRWALHRLRYEPPAQPKRSPQPAGVAPAEFGIYSASSIPVTPLNAAAASYAGPPSSFRNRQAAAAGDDDDEEARGPRGAAHAFDAVVAYGYDADIFGRTASSASAFVDGDAPITLTTDSFDGRGPLVPLPGQGGGGTAVRRTQSPPGAQKRRGAGSPYSPSSPSAAAAASSHAALLAKARAVADADVGTSPGHQERARAAVVAAAYSTAADDAAYSPYQPSSERRAEAYDRAVASGAADAAAGGGVSPWGLQSPSALYTAQPQLLVLSGSGSVAANDPGAAGESGANHAARMAAFYKSPRHTRRDRARELFHAAVERGDGGLEAEAEEEWQRERGSAAASPATAVVAPYVFDDDEDGALSLRKYSSAAAAALAASPPDRGGQSQQWGAAAAGEDRTAAPRFSAAPKSARSGLVAAGGGGGAGSGARGSKGQSWAAAMAAGPVSAPKFSAPPPQQQQRGGGGSRGGSGGGRSSPSVSSFSSQTEEELLSPPPRPATAAEARAILAAEKRGGGVGAVALSARAGDGSNSASGGDQRADIAAQFGVDEYLRESGALPQAYAREAAFDRVPDRVADVRRLVAPFLRVLRLEDVDAAVLRGPLVRALVPGEALVQALFTKLHAVGADADSAAAAHQQQQQQYGGGGGGGGAYAGVLDHLQSLPRGSTVAVSGFDMGRLWNRDSGSAAAAAASVASASSSQMYYAESGLEPAVARMLDQAERARQQSGGRELGTGVHDLALSSPGRAGAGGGGGGGFYADYSSEGDAAVAGIFTGAADFGGASSSGPLSSLQSSASPPAVQGYMRRVPTELEYEFGGAGGGLLVQQQRLEGLDAAAGTGLAAPEGGSLAARWAPVLTVIASQAVGGATGSVSAGKYVDGRPGGVRASSGAQPLVGLAPRATPGHKPLTRRYADCTRHPGGRTAVGDIGLARSALAAAAAAGGVGTPAATRAGAALALLDHAGLADDAGPSSSLDADVYRLFDLSGVDDAGAEDEFEAAAAASGAHGSGSGGHSLLGHRGSGLVGSMSIVGTVPMRFDAFPVRDIELSDGGRSARCLPHVGAAVIEVADGARGGYAMPHVSGSGSVDDLLSGPTQQQQQLFGIDAVAARPNGKRRDPASNVPVSAQPRSGFLLPVLPAVAIGPLRGLGDPAPAFSSAGAYLEEGRGGGGFGGPRRRGSIAGEAPLTLQAAAEEAPPLGFGVMSAGRWAWALVLEESEALFDPLPEGAEDEAEAEGDEGDGAGSGGFGSFYGSDTGAIGLADGADSELGDTDEAEARDTVATDLLLPRAAAGPRLTVVLKSALASPPAKPPKRAAAARAPPAAATPRAPHSVGIPASVREACWEVALCLFPAGRMNNDVRGSDPDACAAMWMATNRGHVFCRQPQPAAAAGEGASGGGGLGPLYLVASGCPFGVSSHVLVSVDTAAHFVGLSISNTRLLSGASALAQQAALRGDGAGGAAVAAAASAQQRSVLSRSSFVQRSPGRASPGGKRSAARGDVACDPSSLGAASTLTPPHNLHHPFHLPSDVHTRLSALPPPAAALAGAMGGGGNAVQAATAHTRDASAGVGGCLHACVMGLPLPPLFARLPPGSRALPSGVAAVQLGLLVRDAEGFAVTLLPPPLLPARAMY